MADKGITYYCSWKRQKDGSCVGWEIRNPRLRAEAQSPDELMRTLGDAISERHNDHEAALHFDPPLSEKGNTAWFADGLVSLAWNAGFTYRPSAPTAFERGRCVRCGGGLGSRTAAPLIVDEITDGCDGATSSVSNEPPPGHGMPGGLIVLSEGFLNLLTDQERATFSVRTIK